MMLSGPADQLASMEFGRAMGNDEPMTPVFPNSDFCIGVLGIIAILNALWRRSAEGRSYKVDISQPQRLSKACR